MLNRFEWSAYTLDKIDEVREQVLKNAAFGLVSKIRLGAIKLHVGCDASVNFTYIPDFVVFNPLQRFLKTWCEDEVMCWHEKELLRRFLALGFVCFPYS